MASDLSNKEIEDGIKKILFSKSNDDGLKSGKHGKNSDRRDFGADTLDPTPGGPVGSSPKRQNWRNRDRPKPKPEKLQVPKSGPSDSPDLQKPSQGNHDSAIVKSERPKKDGKPKKDRHPQDKTSGSEAAADPNYDTSEKAGHAEQKRKRNRGKKKKKSSENPDITKSLSDNSGRPAKSPSPKPEHPQHQTKSKRANKAEEIYKQNLAGLGEHDFVFKLGSLDSGWYRVIINCIIRFILCVYHDVYPSIMF